MQSVRFTSILFAILVVVSNSYEAAAHVVWTGSGETGTDPFGHAWRFQNSATAFQNVANWGIPGRAQGILEYLGDVSVLAIQVEFFNLPAGTQFSHPISNPTMNVSPFTVSDLWTSQSPTATSVLFTPPDPGRTLDPHDQFFLFVPFDRDIDFSTISFRATYFTATAVPEPSSMIAMSTLLAALVMSKSRFRRS